MWEFMTKTPGVFTVCCPRCFACHHFPSHIVPRPRYIQQEVSVLLCTEARNALHDCLLHLGMRGDAHVIIGTPNLDFLLVSTVFLGKREIVRIAGNFLENSISVIRFLLEYLLAKETIVLKSTTCGVDINN